MQTLVDKINEQIEIFQTNANLQLTKNNKAAGTRARKAALEISKLMKEFRKESVEASKQEHSNNIKGRPLQGRPFMLPLPFYPLRLLSLSLPLAASRHPGHPGSPCTPSPSHYR